MGCAIQLRISKLSSRVRNWRAEARAQAMSCDVRHCDARDPAALSSHRRRNCLQNMEQKNSEIRELTDAELEAISGGSWFGNVIHAIGRFFAGPGDHRRPLDRP